MPTLEPPPPRPAPGRAPALPPPPPPLRLGLREERLERWLRREERWEPPASRRRRAASCRSVAASVTASACGLLNGSSSPVLRILSIRAAAHTSKNSAVRADAMRQLQISRDGGFRASRTSNARPHIQVGARRVYSPSTSGQLRARPRRDRPLPWAYRPLARRAWPLPVCSRQLGGVAVLIARRLQARTREVQAGAAHRTRRLQKDVRDIIWRAKLAARTVLAQPPILPARARTPTAPASCVTRSQLMRRCCSHIGAYTLPGLSSCCRCSHIDV